jgi:hypothetical protein
MERQSHRHIYVICSEEEKKEKEKEQRTLVKIFNLKSY